MAATRTCHDDVADAFQRATSNDEPSAADRLAPRPVPSPSVADGRSGRRPRSAPRRALRLTTRSPAMCRGGEPAPARRTRRSRHPRRRIRARPDAHRGAQPSGRSAAATMNTSALAHPATNRSAPTQRRWPAPHQCERGDHDDQRRRYTARLHQRARRCQCAYQITGVVGSRDRGPPLRREPGPSGHLRQDRRVDEPAHAHPGCHGRSRRHDDPGGPCPGNLKARRPRCG